MTPERKATRKAQDSDSKRIRVAAAVIEREGKFLIGKRPRHKRHGGLWEFPGGKLKNGESINTAIRRELIEELKLEVVSIGSNLLSIHDPESPFLIEFIEVQVEGEPQLIEHERVRWCRPRELKALDFAPSDAHFIREHFLY